MSNQTKAAGGLSDPGRIKEVLSRHGFHFSKALGQNFLINPTVCPRMAQACGAGDCKGVIEVGPGIGVLTWELSQVAEKVCAIELDSRLFPVLEETLAGRDNVKIIPGDVMKLDLAQLIQEEFGGGPVCVCANLPYYITSPIVMRLLEERLPVEHITVMVQKEAAERISAAPGTRAAGAISYGVAYYAQPRLLFTVQPGSFFPPPKVTSAVIQLVLRPQPAVATPDEEGYFKLVRAAFGQRRKTAANSVSAGLGIPKAHVMQALEAAGLSPMARPEQLTLEDFCALQKALND